LAVWTGIRGADRDVQEPGDIKYFPSDEPLKLGLEHFDRGHYGVAERYLRDAVEKAPRDATAWVALAATYDRIARFDLADRAYGVAIGLAGEPRRCSTTKAIPTCCGRSGECAQEISQGV